MLKIFHVGIEVTTRKHDKFFRLKRPLVSCERLVSDREMYTDAKIDRQATFFRILLVG